MHLLAAQPKPPDDAEIQNHLAAAREAERKRDYATAGSEYQNVLRLRPNQAIIHQSLALTYHLRNQFIQAIPEFTRALQLDSNLWGSALFLGVDYYKTNQFDRAVTYLEKSLKLNAAEAEPEARFWLGASYAALNRLPEALRSYRRAAELRSKDVEVLYQLAETYDRQAAALFEQIGRIEPRAAAVSLLQKERYLADNRAILARVEYERAIALRPDFEGAIPSIANTGSATAAQDVAVTEIDARAIFGLSRYLASQVEAARASALLTHLAKLEPADAGARAYVAAAGEPNGRSVLPDDHDLWSQLLEARSQAEANQYPAVESVLQKVIQQNPRNLDALLLLGKTYRRWAEQVLKQMIAIDPDSARVHELQGEQQEERGQLDQAISSYQAALQRQPDQAGVRYAIGNAYWKMRRYDSAEQWLSEELKSNPYHGLAHLRLGNLYTEQGKADEAALHLREALAAHPEWIDAHFDLGRALALKGHYGEAVVELQKVAVTDPTNDRVHYVLSNTYRKMGRNQDAQAEMAKYQELTRKRLDRAQQAVRKATDSIQNHESSADKPR